MLLLFTLLAIYVRLEFGHMSDDEFLAMVLPEHGSDTKLITGRPFVNLNLTRYRISPPISFNEISITEGSIIPTSP